MVQMKSYCWSGTMIHCENNCHQVYFILPPRIVLQNCLCAHNKSQLNLIVECVCVAGGWSKQPHLARVRLIRVWGWVRLLHTCGAHWANQGTQVKNHTQTHTVPPALPTNYCISTINRLPSSPCVLVLEEPWKIMTMWRVAVALLDTYNVRIKSCTL